MRKGRTVPKRLSRRAAVSGSKGELTVREHQGWFYALIDTPRLIMDSSKASLGHIYEGRLMIRADALDSALHTLRFSGFTVRVEYSPERLAA